MVTFEVQTKELLRIVKIELNNDAVRTEAGAMYYMLGNITMEAKAPSAGGFLKSLVSAESVVRPVYRGTGQLFLEPSYGDFTIMELNGEEWILDRGAYYASEMSVDVSVFTNKALSGMFSGEGFFQTKVSGRGKVIITSLGPLETIELNNSKLVVDGSFAVARTGNLEFKIEKASKGLFGTAISGEGLVNTFTGTGKVLIAPAGRRDAFFASQMKDLRTLVSASKSSQ
ncbi:MAG TPA: AIM24 family protein [Anaerolineae bacterium]|nr:AIM24 family protein [Anaerolineae bacterium]HQH39469.1 AIM24 family protein [Anaerolineae bacterium]